MIGQLLAKVIGTQNERELKRLYPRVAEIGALEPQIKALTDEQLRAKTAEFRSASPTARRWTICSPKPLPSCARPAAACSTCGTSTCS